MRFLALVPLCALWLLGAAGAQSAGLHAVVEPSQVTLPAGGEANATLGLLNPETSPVTVTLSADAGGLAVAFAQTRVVVPPGSTATVPFTVRAPATAAAETQTVRLAARDAASGEEASATLGVTVTPVSPASPPPVAAPSSAPAPPAPTPADPSPSPAPTAPPAPATSSPPPSPQPPWPAVPPAAAGGEATAAGEAALPRGGVGLAWGLAAGAGAVGLAAALARAARRGWPWLAALYTRLASAEVLEHPQREALAALVREEPGVSFREAQRRLGLASGALTHHARVLERAGVLFSTPDGQHRRFFLTSHGRVDAVPPLGERALASLDAPATLAEVARRLGASRGALRYHVRRLEEQGRLRAQRQGRDVVLSRAEAAARPRPRRARSQEQAARGSPDLPAARQNPSIHVISLRAATSVQDLPCTPETSPGSSQAS